MIALILILILILIVIGWLICGVIGYGFDNAHWKWHAENSWTSIPCSSDEVLSAIIFGPAALLASDKKHGFTLKPWRTNGTP